MPTSPGSIAPTVLLDHQVDAYLGLLGLPRPASATHDWLRRSHRRHLERVPFENLDILLGGEVSLDPERIAAKFTQRRRGGICYELNGGYGSLLASLGFDVTFAETRVKEADGSLGIPLDHVSLIVHLGEPWLCDVGFGSLFDEPIRLTPDEVQTDPAGQFRLTVREDGWWDLFDSTGFRYRFDPSPRALSDFEPGRSHHTTSPASDFTHKTVTTRRTPRGRVTIRGLHAVETVDGIKHEWDVDEVELKALYERWFGCDLDADDIQTLLRIVGAGAD